MSDLLVAMVQMVKMHRMYYCSQTHLQSTHQHLKEQKMDRQISIASL